jgi:hypothetical protein
MSGQELFIQNFQNFGDTAMRAASDLLKFSIETESTDYKLGVAKKIEDFKQSLLTDSNFGSPLAEQPEGYMAKWLDFTKELQKGVDQIKNLAVKQNVDNYLKAVLSEQKTAIAQAQFKGWGKQQVSKVGNQILEAIKNSPPEQALTFAGEKLKGLLDIRLIDPEDYDSKMNAYAQYAIESDLGKKAAAIYDEKGEASALEYLTNAATLVTINGKTYTVGTQALENAKARLQLHAAAAEEIAQKNIREKLDKYMYQSLGGTVPEGETPISEQEVLNAINTTAIKDKETYYAMFQKYRQLASTNSENAGTIAIADAMFAHQKKRTGAQLTPEEADAAKSWEDGSIIKANAKGQAAVQWNSVWESKNNYEKQQDNEALTKTDRKTASSIIDSVSSMAYGIPIPNDGKVYTRESAKTAIDSLVNLPQEDKDNLKKNIDAYFNYKENRESDEASSAAEIAISTSLTEMMKKIQGRQYDPKLIIPEENLGLYASGLKAGRLEYYQGQYTLLAGQLKDKTQEAARNASIVDLDKKIGAYDQDPAKNPLPTTDELDALYNNGQGTITENDYRYYTSQIAARKKAAAQEQAIKNKTAAYTQGLLDIQTAKSNMRKKFNGEEVKEGSSTLTPEWIKNNIPEELQQYAISVMEYELKDEAAITASKAEAANKAENEKILKGYEKQLNEGTLTTEQVNGDANAGRITASQQSIYNDILRRNKEASQRLEDAKQAQQTATDHLLRIREARNNLIKKNNGEKLPEGAVVLSEEWIKDKNNNFSPSETATAAEMLDAETERKAQLDAKAQDAANNTKLMDAMLVTQRQLAVEPEYGRGNIDLHSRPVVTMPNGEIATVRSMTFEEDGKFILVPSISPDGKVLTEKEAWQLYKETGQYLGKFDSEEAADKYAEELHNEQESYYSTNKPITGQGLTPEFVKQVLGDKAANSPYMSMAIAFENDMKTRQQKGIERAWQRQVAEAEKNTIKWANHEEYSGDILSEDLINSMPSSMDPAIGTQLQERFANYKAMRDKVEIDKQQEALGEAAYNSIQASKGEKVKGPLLSRSAIWASNLSLNEKLAYDSLYSSIYEKADATASSIETQTLNLNLDALDTAANIVSRIQAGQITSGTVYYQTWEKNAWVWKTVTLSGSSAKATWQKMADTIAPYAARAGKQSLISEYAKKIDSQPPAANTGWDTVMTELDKMSKSQGKTPALIPATDLQYYKDWLRSKQTESPTITADQASDLINALKAKAWTVKATASFSLSTTIKNDIDTIADMIVSGKAKYYMGRADDLQPKPMHPAYAYAAEWWRNSFIKSAISEGAKGFENISIGTNALGGFTPDGQYWIQINRNKNTEKMFKDMGIKDATRALFNLGQIDGQAYITRQVYYNGNDMRPVVQVLLRGEWLDVLSADPSKPYIYKFTPESVRRMNTIDTEAFYATMANNSSF